uniref:Uncharacterized protein n=1 Tax=Salix viminalis TaxID=40686 RepID=A0A6N2M7P4_SALVM
MVQKGVEMDCRSFVFAFKACEQFLGVLEGKSVHRSSDDLNVPGLGTDDSDDNTEAHETAKVSYSDDMKSCEEAMIDSDNSSLHLASNHIRSCDQESDLNIDSDQAEDFDQFIIKNLPELSDVVSNFQPSIHPKESCRTNIRIKISLQT